MLSVILIDEDARTRNFFSALLSKKGYQVQTTSSGKEGFILALRERPDMIIFDAGISDFPAAELVRKLKSDKRSSGSLCIALIDPAADDKIPDIMAAGCNEFFIKNPEAVKNLLEMLEDPAKYNKPAIASAVELKKQRSGGLMTVFLGAKGGVGTSTLCLNISQNIAKDFPELEVAVLDFVLPIGSAALIAGNNEDFNIQIATNSVSDLEKQTLRRSLKLLENWRFRLLAGSPGPSAAAAIDISSFSNIAESFRQAFDFVAIDIGSSISPAYLPIVHQADLLVLVTSPDLFTVKMTQEILKYLLSVGIDKKKIYVLLNRNIGLEGLSKSDAERILETEIRASTPYMGGAFTLANNQHLPITLKLPNDTATILVDQVSREIYESGQHLRT